MNAQIKEATRYAAHRAKRYNKWAIVAVLTLATIFAVKAAYQADVVPGPISASCLSASARGRSRPSRRGGGLAATPKASPSAPG